MKKLLSTATQWRKFSENLLAASTFSGDHFEPTHVKFGPPTQNLSDSQNLGIYFRKKIFKIFSNFKIPKKIFHSTKLDLLFHLSYKKFIKKVGFHPKIYFVIPFSAICGRPLVSNCPWVVDRLFSSWNLNSAQNFTLEKGKICEFIPKITIFGKIRL